MDLRIERAAEALGRSAPELPPAVAFAAVEASTLPPMLAGVRIAIARDAAFSFLYRANLDTLAALGARLLFFSPLAHEPLPEAQALYLPGGYPELHADRLASHPGLRQAVHAHHAQGRAIVAECGGLLALLETLTSIDGRSTPMLGLLPGQARMQERLVNIGLHSAHLPEGTLRGHSFHHARVDTPLEPAGLTEAERHHGHGEAVYRVGRLHASFLHLYFPSNPQAVAQLFRP